MVTYILSPPIVLICSHPNWKHSASTTLCVCSSGQMRLIEVDFLCQHAMGWQTNNQTKFDTDLWWTSLNWKRHRHPEIDIVIIKIEGYS